MKLKPKAILMDALVAWFLIATPLAVLAAGRIVATEVRHQAEISRKQIQDDLDTIGRMIPWRHASR